MIRNSILKNIEDEFITEAELLNRLDITREKLHQHINDLIATGYEIVQDDEKGFKLHKIPDIIEPFEIKRGLETEYIGNNIHFYKTVESTNITAKKFVKEGAPEGTVIIAESQTAGKSRKGADWKSPVGGIWMTLILRPHVTLIEASKLTIVTGVALAKTLHDEYDIHAGIKWPNDILINDKKICGILTEAIAKKSDIEAVLIGIGIDLNIDSENIPDNLKDIATSVKKELEIELNRADVMRTFFRIFEDLYEEYKAGNFQVIINEWRRLSSTTGNRVKVYKNGKACVADAVGITNEGALIIENDDGTLDKITSGECFILKDDE